MSKNEAEPANDVTASPLPDPQHVPVTFVNDVPGAGFVNGVVNITLSVARFSPMTNGETSVDFEIASRLRMDLHCAAMLHKALGLIIEQNTKPASGTAVN